MKECRVNFIISRMSKNRSNDLSKRYFASDEEMNEEEFAAKENFSFRYVKTDRIPVYFCDHLSFVL